jgi:hypothetical protein
MAAESLIKHNASLLAMDYRGRTALHYAAQHGAMDCVRMLVRCGINVNQRDHERCTPLHLTRDVTVAAHLAVSGARPDLRNNAKQNAVAYFDAKHASGPILEARRAWLSRRAVAVAPAVAAAKGAIEGKQNWVGDESSTCCLLCSAGFGFTTRRHHCRHCGLLVCASCSSRQFLQPAHGKGKGKGKATATTKKASVVAQRCCDGCFNELSASHFEAMRRKREEKRRFEMQKARAAAERAALTPRRVAAEHTIRAQLLDIKAKDVEQRETLHAARAASAAKKQMMENQRLLLERGEKLSELADKSAQLDEDASLFAQLAKKLRKKNEKSSFFGLF